LDATAGLSPEAFAAAQQTMIAAEMGKNLRVVLAAFCGEELAKVFMA
jgi:hypothetical protein